MGRRGPKPKQKEEEKPATGAGAEETITLPNAEPQPRAGDTVEAPVNPESKPETLTSDTYLYHAEHEPRVFKAGSEIKDGWQRKRVFDGFVWCPDDFGKWSKVAK